MKKYRLKLWYPSLYDDIEVGTIVDYEDGWIYYTNKRGYITTNVVDEWELSLKDFWEIIEEKGVAMKKYTIEITDDGKTANISRKNDGFNVIELIGFMEMTKHDLINQAKGLAEDNVDTITKKAVKKE